jgi:hypothetical protein
MFGMSYAFFWVCSLNANVSACSVCFILIGERVWSVTAVEKVKRFGYKIAWSPHEGAVGVGASRENKLWRQRPQRPQVCEGVWLGYRVCNGG